MLRDVPLKWRLSYRPTCSTLDTPLHIRTIPNKPRILQLHSVSIGNECSKERTVQGTNVPYAWTIWSMHMEYSFPGVDVVVGSANFRIILYATIPR